MKGLSQLTDWSALTKRAGQLTWNAFDQLRHLKEGQSFLYEALGQLKREDRLAAAIGTVRQDFSRHPARVHLGKAAEKVEDHFKIKKSIPSEDINKWWLEQGYDKPPYTPGTKVQEIELIDDTKFVRVYDGENSHLYGGWLMKAEDIKGLSASQIQNKFALPIMPKFVGEVTIPKGSVLRMGEVNPLFGLSGGGTQFDLMGQYIGEFKELGKISK